MITSSGTMRGQVQEVSEVPVGDESTSKSIAVTDGDANAVGEDAQGLGQSAFAALQQLQGQLQRQSIHLSESALTQPSEPSTSTATRSSEPVTKLEDDDEMLRSASTAQAPGRWASMFRRSKDKK